MNSSKILISVCVITYKHERFIAQALESALMQKGDFEIEIVVGDDASPDDTRKICEDFALKYPSIIKLLPPIANLGAMRNFARTFAACSGKYVALLEGDDYWTDPSKLQRQLEFLENNSSYAFASHRGLNYVMDRNEFIEDKLSSRDLNFMDFAIHNCMIHTMSVMFRNDVDLMELFEKPWVKYLSGGDLLLYFEMTKDGAKGRVLDNVMGVYRIHSTGSWQGISSISRIQSAERDLKLYLENLSLDESQKEALKWQLKDIIVGKLNYKLAGNWSFIRRGIVFFFNRVLFCFGPGKMSAALGDIVNNRLNINS